jgi:dTDP-4-amino-4,6-dideoxygalactose transaminase
LAAGLGPGDEAIVPSFTFVATPNAVRYTGATPVLCDVRSPLDPQIDPADVERRIGPRTRAVVAVHFWGYPAATARLRELCDERDLVLIEDAAEAIGAELDTGGMAGTAGELGCLSFFSKKQLCVGEGGAVLTAAGELADRVRSLRSHGMTTVTWDRHRGYAETYDVVEPGFNFRMDEPRAALGSSRITRLASDIQARREVARGYRARLADLPGLELPFEDGAVDASSHFAFPVLLRDRVARDAFREELHALGVQTTWYPVVHRFSEYAVLTPGLELPQAEAVADRHCALPMASTLTDTTLDLVAESVEQALAAVRRRAA